MIRFAVGRADGKASMDDLDTKVRETVAVPWNFGGGPLIIRRR